MGRNKMLKIKKSKKILSGILGLKTKKTMSNVDLQIGVWIPIPRLLNFPVL